MWKFGRSKRNSATIPVLDADASQARALASDTSMWADGEGRKPSPRQPGRPSPSYHQQGSSDSVAKSPGGGQRVVAQLDELQQTLQAQRSQIDDLHQTVQEQHRQIVQQSNQVEALKTLLRDVKGANEPAPVVNPAWWGSDDGEQVERPPPTVADVAALSMGQILQQLHEAQDLCVLREEEVHQVEAALKQQELAIRRLEKEKERCSRLVLGLKKELHHYKLLVREKSKTNATMEVELELARLEKISMTRMVSNMDEGSDAEHVFLTPPHLLPPSVETSPERAAPDAAANTRLRAEVQTLQAELAAARSLAEAESKRRLALEQEVERLRRALQQGGGGGGVETESEASEGPGGEELTLLVLKEQLSPFRELNVGFQSMWEACATDFKVRGKTYMADGIKVDGGDPLFELVHMEIFNVDPSTGLQRADHVTAMFKEADADSVYMRCAQSSRPPFLLIINFQVPGTPPCSVVAYMALAPHLRTRLEKEVEVVRARKAREAQGLGPEVADGQGQGAEAADADATVLRLLAEFLEGEGEYRDSRLKLIPSVVEGPLTVRWGVGNKPVVLGKKITQRYFTGPGYLEVGVDIGSSVIASKVLGTIREFSRNIVIETALVLQGEQESELPERILAGMRFSRVDWRLAEKLSERLKMPLISPRPAST